MKKIIVAEKLTIMNILLLKSEVVNDNELIIKGTNTMNIWQPFMHHDITNKIFIKFSGIYSEHHKKANILIHVYFKRQHSPNS